MCCPGNPNFGKPHPRFSTFLAEIGHENSEILCPGGGNFVAKIQEFCAQMVGTLRPNGENFTSKIWRKFGVSRGYPAQASADFGKSHPRFSTFWQDFVAKILKFCARGAGISSRKFRNFVPKWWEFCRGNSGVLCPKWGELRLRLARLRLARIWSPESSIFVAEFENYILSSGRCQCGVSMGNRFFWSRDFRQIFLFGISCS